MTTHSPTTSLPSTDPSAVARHFEQLLSVETDCWDVHEALVGGDPGFVLLQVNGSPESFASEHIDGAVHLHHRDITGDALSGWPADIGFVVYCSGPHCNAADRAALKLSRLGRSVRKMIGGKTGWIDEGFTFVGS